MSRISDFVSANGSTGKEEKVAPFSKVNCIRQLVANWSWRSGLAEARDAAVL